jgi:hypothetical protein
MNNLPKIQDLYNEVQPFSKEEKAFQALMNEVPHPEWVKVHPFITGYKYLPIERIDFLLKSVFPAYKVEVTGQGIAFNGVYVTVRLHYKHPVNGEWLFHDGIGGAQLQTKKGQSPADLANINNGAVSMAFPIAKTEAVKNAASHFGRLFGSDLNRKSQMKYETVEQIMPFERGHKFWDKAVDAIKAKTATIEQIKAKYNLTELGEKQLMEDVSDEK